MLRKLEVFGIREVAGSWFRSHLESRKQYCKLNCHESGAKVVTCGIPQGSCLHPLLFIAYRNDFGKCLNLSKAGMYADDTHLLLASKNINELIQRSQDELDSISE